MAFGISRKQLIHWKKQVLQGKIAIITHYWYDQRFPDYQSVTKVGCIDLPKLIKWGETYHLRKEWIDQRNRYPHFDLFGDYQVKVLFSEEKYEQIRRFNLESSLTLKQREIMNK